LPKYPRLTAKEAEEKLLASGFVHIRSKGSHRIYLKENIRMVIPFHGNKILHPKIIKQLMKALEDIKK